MGCDLLSLNPGWVLLGRTLRSGVSRVARAVGFDVRDKIIVVSLKIVGILWLQGIKGPMSRVAIQREVIPVILPVVVDIMVEGRD